MQESETIEEEALVELGLTNNEARVYLTLLGKGEMPANEMARLSGVHRVNVYDIIDRLLKKGLIAAAIKTNKYYYKASDPRDLALMLEEKKDRLNEVLPKLKSMYHSAPEKEEVFYFKGPDSVIKAYYMLLEQKQPIYGIGGRGANRLFLKHRHKRFTAERVKRKIPGKVLYFENYSGMDIGGPLIEVRFLPKEYENPAMIDICGNMVLILLATDDISGILIKNRHIAKGYMNYFNILWNIAKKSPGRRHGRGYGRKRGGGHGAGRAQQAF